MEIRAEHRANAENDPVLTETEHKELVERLKPRQEIIMKERDQIFENDNKTRVLIKEEMDIT